MHGTGWYARTTDLFDMPRVPDAAAAEMIANLKK
jgi:hypothetical protein